MRDILYMLITSVLANNIIFVRFEGLCGFLGSAGKKACLIYVTLSTGFVLVLSSAINGLLFKLILEPLRLTYLDITIYLFVIACLVQLCVNFAGKISKKFKNDLGILPVLILTNSAVLSVSLDNVTKGYGLGMSVFAAFCLALSYALAALLMGSVNERIQSADIPESFRGIPALLLAAAIVSLAFFGFSGVVDGIFGM